MRAGLPGTELTVAAFDGGDREIDALAHAWLPHVYRWCHRFGGPKVDAEDAAHESLMVMCRKLSQVSDPEVFPAWLFSICKRVIANHRRKAWFMRWVPGPVKERPASGWSPLRTVEAREHATQVWRVLKLLPEIQREVLVLSVLEERRGPEVATLLNIPLGTVKSRLRLARAGFKERWTALYGAPDHNTLKEVG